MLLYDYGSLSFIIQGIFLILLIYGFYLVREKKYKQHGYVFLLLTTLHFLSLFIIMIPAFLENASSYISNLFDVEYAISLIHIIIGATTEVIAAIIIINWVKNKYDVSKCFNKKAMRIIAAFWFTSFFIGAVIHLIF